MHDTALSRGRQVRLQAGKPSLTGYIHVSTLLHSAFFFDHVDLFFFLFFLCVFSFIFFYPIVTPACTQVYQTKKKRKKGKKSKTGQEEEEKMGKKGYLVYRVT